MASDFNTQSLSLSLNRMDGAVGRIATSRGLAQLEKLRSTEFDTYKRMLHRASLYAAELMKTFLIENCASAGLGGELLRFMTQAHTSAQPEKISVFLPDGLKFKNGGNVYAAAGAFVYGAVRQPLTKKVGSLYKDLPTGEYRKRAKAVGDFGAKAKQSIKNAVLHGIHLSNRQGKALKAIAGGKVSVIAPRPPFFRTTPAQDSEIQDRWIKALRDAFIEEGIEVA